MSFVNVTSTVWETGPEATEFPRSLANFSDCFLGWPMSSEGGF
jgi:hypothetical protein